jgi:hypothetical protein
MTTKGPWQVIEDPIESGKFWICDCVKVVPVGYGPIGFCNSKDDALAIAAVPDMIEALQACVCKAYPGCEDCTIGDERCINGAQEKVLSALKKAGVE